MFIAPLLPPPGRAPSVGGQPPPSRRRGWPLLFFLLLLDGAFGFPATTILLAIIGILLLLIIWALCVAVVLAVYCWPISLPLLALWLRARVWKPRRIRADLREKGYDWITSKQARQLKDVARRLPPRDEMILAPGYEEGNFARLNFLAETLREHRAPKPSGGGFLSRLGKPFRKPG